MFNSRSPQTGLWDCDYLYGDFVGKDTFYYFLASQRGKIFKDEDFADLYCKDNGRPSKPPSILATALVLQTHDNGKFSKSEFKISRDEKSVKCPGGCTTRKYKLTKIKKSNGNTYRVKRFFFPKERCLSCGLRDQCAKGKGARSITLHPQEHLMQKARRHQKTKAFRESKRRRQVVEHRIARLRQLGVRQSRYFGRVKTLFQLMMAATVANLTLVAASAAPRDSFFRLIPAFCAAIVRAMFKSAPNFNDGAIISQIDNFLSVPIILLLLRPQRSAYTCVPEKQGFQPGF